MKIKPRFLLGIVKRNLIELKMTTEKSLTDYFKEENQIKPNIHQKIEDSINVLIVLAKLEALPGSEKFIEDVGGFLHSLNKS